MLIGACNLHVWFPLDCNFQTSINSRGDTTWCKNMLMQNPLHVQKCRWFEDGIRRFPHCFSSFRLLNLHQLQCRCSFSWFPSSHCWNFLVYPFSTSKNTPKPQSNLPAIWAVPEATCSNSGIPSWHQGLVVQDIPPMIPCLAKTFWACFKPSACPPLSVKITPICHLGWSLMHPFPAKMRSFSWGKYRFWWIWTQ